MPCYDPRGNEPRIIYQDRDNPKDKETIALLINDNNYLNAGLCAIITELDKRNLTGEILPEASRKGLIDLMTFWSRHKKDDESKLRLDLHRYSIHEQEVLRKILNETTVK